MSVDQGIAAAAKVHAEHRGIDLSEWPNPQALMPDEFRWMRDAINAYTAHVSPNEKEAMSSLTTEIRRAIKYHVSLTNIENHHVAGEHAKVAAQLADTLLRVSSHDREQGD